MSLRKSRLLRVAIGLSLLLAPLAITATERSPVRVVLLYVRDLIFTRRADPAVRNQVYDSLGVFEMASVAFPRDSVRQALQFLGLPESPPVSVEGRDAEATLAPIMQFLPTSGGVGCGSIRRLQRKVAAIRAGSRYGCCSDFVEVFQLVATAYGIRTREVQNIEHAFAEFWYEPERRWIMFDPQEGLLVADGGGRLLSAREVGSRALRGLQMSFREMRTAHPDRNIEAFVRRNYGRDRWAYLRITLGSDVIAQDRMDGKLTLLPQSIAQLVSYGVGQRPGYLELSSQIFDPTGWTR